MNTKLVSDNTGRALIMGREGSGVMNENGELFGVSVYITTWQSEVGYSIPTKDDT